MQLSIKSKYTLMPDLFVMDNIIINKLINNRYHLMFI